MPSPLLLRSASDQARLIAAAQLDSRRLIDEQIAEIDARNPILNAFVAVRREASRLENIDATLAGVSFAVKDNIDVLGLPTHAGLRARHADAAIADAPVVRRLKAAGLACLGKLNMHPAALGATNHNADFGDCRHPMLPTHTPGGSSGGSGAAVAAGLCSIALGTDTMGSVRIPASYCGVVGFKPSFGMVSTQGVVPLCRLLDQVGVLARSVEDVTHVFEIVAEASVRERAQALLMDHRQIRLAVPGNLQALAIQPSVHAAFEAALQRLRDAGWRIDALDLSTYPLLAARRAAFLLAEAELLDTLAQPLREARDELPPDLLKMLDYAARKSAGDAARALATVVEAGQWLTRALSGFDALLTPTTPQTSFAMHGPVPPTQADMTSMANLTGGPALSLPLPVAAHSLPIGLQVMGHRGDDRHLLDLARRLEAVLSASMRRD